MKIFNKLSLFALSLTAVAGTTIGGFSKVANSVNAEVEASNVTKYVKAGYQTSDYSGEYTIGWEENTTTVRLWNGNSGNGNSTSFTVSNSTIEDNTGIANFNLEKSGDGYLFKVAGGDNDGKYLSFDSSKKHPELAFATSGVELHLTYDTNTKNTKITTTVEGSNYRQLKYCKYDNTDSNSRFRFILSTGFGKNNDKQIQLFKKITATTAEDWKTEFMDATNGICDPNNPKPNSLASLWTVSKASFDNLPTEEQEKLSTLTVADDFKDAIERYEYIVRTYNVDTISDFIGRDIVTNANINLFRQNSSNNNVLILSFAALGVVSISLVSFFLVRRKRSK